MQCADLLRYCLMTSQFVSSNECILDHCTSKCLASPVYLKYTRKLKKIIIWENFSHLNEINLNSIRAHLLLLLLFSTKAPKGLKVNARVFPLIYQESDIASAIFLSGTQCLRTKPMRGFPLKLNIPQKCQAKASNSLGLESLGCTPVVLIYSPLITLDQP